MVLCAPLAWSDGGRITVIEPDPRVLEAVEVALAPWNLRVVRAPGPLPEDDVAAATASARALAQAQHASAVVWVARPRGSQVLALWVYDAQTEQLVVRPLSVAAPFDEAGAAAVALSVKAILRTSPWIEREVPGPAVPASPLSSPSSAPPALPPPPSPPKPAGATSAPSVPPEPPPTHAQTSPEALRPFPPRLEPEHAWRLEAIVGARAPSGATAAAEPQAALGASFWPAPLRRHVGAGALVQAGPGVTIDQAAFRGQFTQACFVLTARARATTGAVSFELQAGPSLRVTSIDGAALVSGTSFHSVRANPTFDGGGVLDIALSSHIALGAQVDFSTLLRFQRYTLNGTTLFDEPTIDVLFGARLAVEVD